MFTPVSGEVKRAYPPHVELFGAQAEKVGVEALRRLDVRHLEVGDDAGGAHEVLLPNGPT
jgi:hypothetical protein